MNASLPPPAFTPLFVHMRFCYQLTLNICSSSNRVQMLIGITRQAQPCLVELHELVPVLSITSIISTLC